MNVDVLALGDSVKKYEPTGDITIGVNDIWRYHKVNNLLIIDPQKNFTPDRLAWIWNSRPKKMYSHLGEWSFMPNFEQIKLRHDKEISFEAGYPISIISPYVAVGMAYHLYKPSTITMYGVDIVNHSKIQHKLPRIIEDFRRMFIFLQSRNCVLQLGVKHGSLLNYLPSN